MDATEDSDLQLERASPNLLSDLAASLPKFLWLPKRQGLIGTSPPARRTVRDTTTGDLIKLLEPFQEWPQLLDPHLKILLPPLIDAYIDCLSRDDAQDAVSCRLANSFSIPLAQAICRMLYVFCKIRGHKVISRFFNNEPKYIELMLASFQKCSTVPSLGQKEQAKPFTPLIWEEKYVMMLWLSHLLLTPFDLALIDSEEFPDHKLAPLHMRIPDQLPSVALRIIHLCVEQLISPGKEREAAVISLVRLALRPDMQRVGLLTSLVKWAVTSLDDHSVTNSPKSIYAHIGVLSFISGILTSADVKDVLHFLLPFSDCVQRINKQTSPQSTEIVSSALARKIFVKILRAISVIALRLTSTHTSVLVSDILDAVLEDTVEYLLNALADKDALVRYAASKSLSLITFELQPMMAAEIVETVIAGLEEDVIWDKQSRESWVSDDPPFSYKSKIINLAAVNPLKWQGLTLTLSHLVFRRSPPPEQLPAILNALLLALKFEQRSTLGKSSGTSVRDAACFGLWSLARRYTTKELLAVNMIAVRAADRGDKTVSTLQTLADELVAAALLDSSGNIRRGASAALQELIGRHPDTIIKGISLVQVVDYHAVALRSKALVDVADNATKLHPIYWDTVLEAVVDWRGIDAPDADSRRLAAETIGLLSESRGDLGTGLVVQEIGKQLHALQHRQVEKRHGLLLAAAAVVKKAMLSPQSLSAGPKLSHLSSFWNVFNSSNVLVRSDFKAAIKPDLTAEAACSLISSLASMSFELKTNQQDHTMIPQCLEYVNLSLSRENDTVVRCAANSAKNVLRLLEPDQQKALIEQWIANQPGRAQSGGRRLGYLTALGAVYEHSSKDEVKAALQNSILRTILMCTRPDKTIATRIAAVRSMREGVFHVKTVDDSVADAILGCLGDHTIDQRGDIGSLLRIEASAALRTMQQYGTLGDSPAKEHLVGTVCGLAVEKLDKVRFEAWKCLEHFWAIFGKGEAPHYTDIHQTSTPQYYHLILSLSSINWTIKPLLEGFVTSAGAGAESVLRASRTALVLHLERLENEGFVLFLEEYKMLLQDNIAKERILLPLLEVLDFMIETGILNEQASNPIWFQILQLIQRVQKRSKTIPTLLLVMKIYTGLSAFETVQPLTLTTSISMLLHPFPKVRCLSADLLYTMIPECKFLQDDWSRSLKELGTNISGIRQYIVMDKNWYAVANGPKKIALS